MAERGLLAQSVASSSGGLLGDYFDQTIAKTLPAQQFRIEPLPPQQQAEMMSFLLGSPWLSGIQQMIRQESGKDIPKEELLREMMSSGDYDYATAWREMGPSMFAVDPASNTYHGFSRAPSGRWLKSPGHETTWKEIYMQETGYSPDPDYGTAGESISRPEAAAYLGGVMQRGPQRRGRK